jgi:small subunit ribosomal protein S2
MSSVTMKQLLEAGVHFGHQSRRWNPKMKPYIYTERNGIYIIDLKKTLRLLRDAMRFIRDSVQEGQQVLLVGTKKQAKDIIRESAEESGMHYVNNRWLGGLLTNFRTVRKSVVRLIELERMFADGTINLYGKKEQAAYTREMNALRKNLDGIKKMERLPDIMFVIDPFKEAIAIREANTLGIPVVSVVDTNCDPDQVTWVIPGNDDAIRSIKLMCGAVAEACREGLNASKSDLLVSDGSTGYAPPPPAAPAAAAEPVALTAEELEARFAVYQQPGSEAPAAAPQA